MLTGSDAPLTEIHDLAMLDLDGVVYISGAAVPGAPEHLRSARDAGLRLAFITNNASRPPAEVAHHLTELGVAATGSDVVTSAQAAARLLRDRLGTGARVVSLGASGLETSLAEAGLVPVGPGDDAAAVATGYGPDVEWRHVMQVAVRIRDGLPWVASNTDHTIPTAYGVAPGHGVLVEALQRFTGVDPTVAGKPQRPLLDETIRRMSGQRPLMVGDRLDTDIEGAHNVGVPSLLVRTGVTGLVELVAATQETRPTYLAADLGGLLVRHPQPECDDGGWRVGGWRAIVSAEGRLEIAGHGTDDDWWRAAVTAAWDHRDRCGEVPDITGLGKH